MCTMNKCIASLIFRQTIPYDLHSYDILWHIMNMRNAQILQHRTHSFRFSQTCPEQMGFRGGQAYDHHKPRRTSLLKQWIESSGRFGSRSVQTPGYVWFHSIPQSPCLHIRTYSTSAHCLSFPGTSPGYLTGCVDCMQKVFTDGDISEANTSASLIAAQALGHKTVSFHIETKMSLFWWNFHYWLHWKLSLWQLPVQPVIKNSQKLRHFLFSACRSHFY